MKKLMAIALSAVIGVMTVGCATSAANIATQSVSPIPYRQYDCEQLSSESLRVKTKLTTLGSKLDQSASNDAAIMGVALILFWPAIFALGGTKQQEAEYGQLKGEYDALQVASIARKCA